MRCRCALALLAVTGCNAVAGLDDLSFSTNSASSSTASGGEAGAAPGGMGGQGGGGGAGGCRDSQRAPRVFVTNDDFGAAELGGLRTADVLCQSAADAAELGGCWRAWLSDETTAAPDRICPGGPWMRMDGAPVAVDCIALLDGSLENAIDLTETGAVVSVGVWTGTAALGGILATCNSWTSNSPADEGIQGLSNGIDVSWSDSGATTCEDVGSLYCFEL